MKNLFEKSLLLSLLMGISFQAGSAETQKVEKSEIKAYPHSSRHYYSVACSNGWTAHFDLTDENACSTYTNGTQTHTYKTPEACSWQQDTPPYSQLRQALNREVGDLFCPAPITPGLRSITRRDDYLDVTCLDGTGATFWGSLISRPSRDQYIYQTGTLVYEVGKWDEFEAKVARPYCEKYSKAPPLSTPTPPATVPVFNKTWMTWMKSNELTFTFEEAKHFCEREMNNKYAEFGSAKWHLPTNQEIENLWNSAFFMLSKDEVREKLKKFGLTGEDNTLWTQFYGEETKGFVFYFNPGEAGIRCVTGDEKCPPKHKVLCVKD